MSRRTRWKDLIIGLAALCAVAGVALAILVLCRPGRLRGKTVTVYVTADAARGLIPGSEVWLDGQKVGLVKSVKFRPATVSTKDRLVLRLDVLDNARTRLRVDSRVDIRSGTSIIGDQVVYLSSGTARRRGIAEGDTIHGGKQSDIEGMTADMALASREFPGIIENVKLLARSDANRRGNARRAGTGKRRARAHARPHQERAHHVQVVPAERHLWPRRQWSRRAPGTSEERNGPGGLHPRVAGVQPALARPLSP